MSELNISGQVTIQGQKVDVLISPGTYKLFLREMHGGDLAPKDLNKESLMSHFTEENLTLNKLAVFLQSAIKVAAYNNGTDASKYTVEFIADALAMEDRLDTEFMNFVEQEFPKTEEKK